jgi:hypothetical protein
MIQPNEAFERQLKEYEKFTRKQKMGESSEGSFLSTAVVRFKRRSNPK